MRTEWKLFFFLGVFMTPLAVIYWVTSREESGIILLFVTAIACFFMGLYLRSRASKMDGLRPEDRAEATQADGVGEVGTFPVGSIWPFVAACGVTLIAFAITFQGFLMIPALGLILFAVAGMARESSEGDFHHEELTAHNAPAEEVGEFEQAQVKK